MRSRVSVLDCQRADVPWRPSSEEYISKTCPNSSPQRENILVHLIPIGQIPSDRRDVSPFFTWLILIDLNTKGEEKWPCLSDGKDQIQVKTAKQMKIQTSKLFLTGWTIEIFLMLCFWLAQGQPLWTCWLSCICRLLYRAKQIQVWQRDCYTNSELVFLSATWLSSLFCLL